MGDKTKTPGGYPGASKTCHSRVARQAKYPTKTALNQANQVPVPGTALSAFLKKYRNELLACEFSREISSAVDCVDCLLDLVPRRQL